MNFLYHRPFFIVRKQGQVILNKDREHIIDILKVLYFYA